MSASLLAVFLLTADPAPSASDASLAASSLVAADAASSSAVAPEAVVGHCERLSEALLRTSRGLELLHAVPFRGSFLESSRDLRPIEALRQVLHVLHEKAQCIVRERLNPGHVSIEAFGFL